MSDQVSLIMETGNLSREEYPDQIKNCNSDVYFFFPGLRVAILLKSSRSENFYLLHSYVRDPFKKCYSNKVQLYKAIANYILDTQINILRSESYEFQHVTIIQLSDEVRLRKKIKNLVRSHEIKVCKSLNERGSNDSRAGIVQG